MYVINAELFHVNFKLYKILVVLIVYRTPLIILQQPPVKK